VATAVTLSSGDVIQGIKSPHGILRFLRDGGEWMYRFINIWAGGMSRYATKLIMLESISILRNAVQYMLGIEVC
jgi:hypothetical protein